MLCRCCVGAASVLQFVSLRLPVRTAGGGGMEGNGVGLQQGFKNDSEHNDPLIKHFFVTFAFLIIFFLFFLDYQLLILGGDVVPVGGLFFCSFVR